MTSLAELQQHVERCFARYESLGADGAVLAAVSGGIDSSVLAIVLQRLHLAGRLPGPVVLAHVDHAQHPRSQDALHHVAEFSRRLGVGFLSRRVAGIPPGASEDTLRTVRYALLQDMAAQCRAGWIVTAHHADDDLETVLFRMLRGTGLRGLAGIPEHRQLGPRLHLLRPFLRMRRVDLERTAAAERVLHFEDPTNRDLRYARNALRHEVIPALRRAGVARDLDHSLLTLARTARAAAAVLDAQALRLLRERSRDALPWRVELDLRGLGDDDVPFFDECLRRLDLRLRGEHGPSPATVLRRVRAELWDAPAGTRVHGKGAHALLFERTRDGILALAPEHAGSPPDVPLPIEPGDAMRFGSTEWHVRARLCPEPPTPEPATPDPALPRGLWRAVLDLRRAPPPWTLRTRRHGDRFQPIGMTHTLDLRRYLQSHHVPRFHRDRLPLLVDDRDRILWIPGVGVAACAALPPAPRSCVEWQVEAR